MLEPFGPNVVSVEGDAWRKHIRITVPPFGEAVNKLVWEETFRQANMLTSSWAYSGSGDLKRDIYSLTVNIMSCVGFGKPAEWTDDMNATPAGHSITLVSAIMGVVTNLAPLLLLPKWVLKHSSLNYIYEAYVEFEKYMNEYLNEEKQKIAMNQNYESKVKGNLLTAVLKSSTSGMMEKDPGKPSEKLSFTDEEVRGNVFMFLLAGMLNPSFHLPLRTNRQNQRLRHDGKHFAIFIHCPRSPPRYSKRNDSRSRPRVQRSLKRRPNRTIIHRRPSEISIYPSIHGTLRLLSSQKRH
jgi:cytochrome P450